MEHNHAAMTHQHGLQDECPRCKQQAERPGELDAENLRRIWGGTIITRTDMDAYNVLYRSAVLTQRLEEAYMYDLFGGLPQRVRERSEVNVWEHGGRA